MRRAELLMAFVLALLSVYLMWKSWELPIGWIRDEGPGGGAFPFWLSVGMLASCIWIVVRWVLRSSPLSHSKAPYMTSDVAVTFAAVAGSLTVMLGAIHFIGMYFSIPLFLNKIERVLFSRGHAFQKRTDGWNMYFCSFVSLFVCSYKRTYVRL